MKISVITVCRNAQELIENTLLSVFQQTYMNYEYIVIDGASTDKTVAIIEKYKDKISYFISEPDAGIYNAMNKGIKAATGDVLYFLNAGDTVYDENVFSEIIDEFNNYPQAELIFGDIYFRNNKNLSEHQIKPERIFTFHRFLFNLSLYHLALPHQATFFQKHLFDKYGLYREDFKINGDREFYLRTMIKEKILFKYKKRIVVNYLMGGISELKENLSIHQKENDIIKKEYPLMNETDFIKYKFIVKILYPFMMRNFRWLFRKYNKDIKLKEAVNRFIAQFIGGHLNVIYDPANSVAGEV